MDEITFPILVRSLIVVVTFGVAVWFAVHTWRWWRIQELHQHFLHVGCGFLIVAMGIRSLEAMRDGDPLKYALIFYVVGLLCFIIYLTYPRQSKRKPTSR